MTPDTLLILSAVILIIPLISFLILVFFGKRLGDKAGAAIGTTMLGIDLLLSVYVCYVKLVDFGDAGMIQMKFNWLMLGTKDVSLGMGIDNIAVIMLIVVNLISFLVHLFSVEYMRGDKRYTRYFAYLGIFTFSMLGIVIANNLLNMYIFWELVGVSSYLLIGFWYEKDSASNASKKAFITNRIGDFGLLAGVLILFLTYGTFMFDDIFAQIGLGVLPFDSGTWLTVSGILLFCGAIGKSAQFPLHVWLPDAMEGPTPVSALIHAATMVAAGVYFTARIFPMLTADALLLIAYIGALTAFMAATIALTQNDFKKVLAYSTVSQLGYMIMAIGVGAFTNGFFHLVTHAWFKACLFLASGSVIHAMHHALHAAKDHHTDPQDIRNMGGLRKTMPLTYLMFLIATLAISGVPFTSGFLSKDGILAGTLAFGSLSGHWLIPLAGFGAAGMTAFYMFRLMIEAFHGKPKTEFAAHTHENNRQITGPLILLAFLSFFIWYSFNPFDGSSGWFASKTQTPKSVVPAEYQFDFIVPYEDMPDNSAHSEANIAEAGLHTDGGQTAGQEHSEGHNAPDNAEHHGMNKFEEEIHNQHYPAMILSLIIAGLGILISFAIYQFKLVNPDNLARQFNKLYKFSLNKWYFDEFYAKTFIGGTILLSRILSWFDLKFVDGIVNATAVITNFVSMVVGKFDNLVIDGFVNLTANATGLIGAALRKFQTGRVQSYVAFAIIGFMIILYMVA